MLSSPIGSLEKLDPELVFEKAYLAADRALRQRQLAGGGREAAELGDGIKGGESTRRWQEAALVCEHAI